MKKAFWKQGLCLEGDPEKYLEGQNLCLGQDSSLGHNPGPVHSRRKDRMPTYDYACEKCGHGFQRVETITEHGSKKVKCPECKSTRVERVFSSVFVKTRKKS